MSWQSYIENLQTPDKNGVILVREAAIWGATLGQVSVWAATKGQATKITQEEVQKLLGDRSSFRSNGPFIAGIKCMMLRDQLDMDGVYSLDLRTKGEGDDSPFPICVGKTKMAVIIAMGSKDTPGGALLDKVFNIVKHLRDSNM